MRIKIEMNGVYGEDSSFEIQYDDGEEQVCLTIFEDEKNIGHICFVMVDELKAAIAKL